MQLILIELDDKLRFSWLHLAGFGWALWSNTGAEEKAGWAHGLEVDARAATGDHAANCQVADQQGCKRLAGAG